MRIRFVGRIKIQQPCQIIILFYPFYLKKNHTGVLNCRLCCSLLSPLSLRLLQKPEMICSLEACSLSLPSFSLDHCCYQISVAHLSALCPFIKYLWLCCDTSTSVCLYHHVCPLTVVLWSCGHVPGMGVAGLSMGCRCEKAS